MAISVKLLGDSVSVTGPNTVNNAGYVLLTVTELTLVTQHDAESNQLGSVVLDRGSYAIRKSRTDTLSANVAVHATSVSSA